MIACATGAPTLSQRQASGGTKYTALPVGQRIGAAHGAGWRCPAVAAVPARQRRPVERAEGRVESGSQAQHLGDVRGQRRVDDGESSQAARVVEQRAQYRSVACADER